VTYTLNPRVLPPTYTYHQRANPSQNLQIELKNHSSTESQPWSLIPANKPPNNPLILDKNLGKKEEEKGGSQWEYLMIVGGGEMTEK
jgi:hypothetical protein